jgi:predicted secreted protein
VTGDYAGMSWRALRLAREEPDQVLRLQAFRAAHPDVIIGDGGFGVWQARVPEPGGEHVISRYTLRELLGKLDELTGEDRSQSDSGQD